MILLLLLLGCAPSAPAEAPAVEAPQVEATPPARPSIVHVDVPGKAAEGRGRFKADWSFDLVATKAWSAHVHVIPQGQIIPWHRHPENDELVFIASGKGEWLQGEGSFALEAGDAVESAPGVVHGVRNRDPEPLVTVVVQRPEFGQNWYVVPSEIEAAGASRKLGEAEAFAGWSIDWWSGGADDGTALYLVAEGLGDLVFEETRLPLKPGTFVKAPQGRARAFEGEGLRILRIRIPGG